jgi:hypothetical protein
MTMWRPDEQVVTGAAYLTGEPVVAAGRRTLGFMGESVRRTRAGRSRSDLLPGLARARWGEGLGDGRGPQRPVALAPMEIGTGDLA